MAPCPNIREMIILTLLLHFPLVLCFKPVLRHFPQSFSATRYRKLT